MVIGLVATGLFSILPLAFTGPLAFVILRAGAGLSTALYDPAARGYLTDATPPERRGEAFGLYGAVQMGGLLLGPAIGAIGASWFGGIAFVFVFCGVASWLGAIPIALLGRESGVRTRPAPAPDATEFPPEAPTTTGRAAADVVADRADPGAPSRLWNRGLIGALVINVGGYYAGGTYEVIWSLFLTHLGAGLDLVGLTFAMFGLPVLLLSPLRDGRRRRGSLAFIVIGSSVPCIVGIATRDHGSLWRYTHHDRGGVRSQPGLRGRRRRTRRPANVHRAGLFGAAGPSASSPSSSPGSWPKPISSIRCTSSARSWRSPSSSGWRSVGGG
jgi:MFS family permease